MLTGLHFLLTYSCNFECDHCFLYCSPRAEGTFKVAQLREVLDDATRIKSMTDVFIEGGESFLFYPIVVETVRMSHERGFKTGIVTNCYWATSVEDAGLWLRPLVEAGLDVIHLSDDAFHHDQGQKTPAQRAKEAAASLGLGNLSICIDEPTVTEESGVDKGAPVIGGGARFRGRAADKLTEGLPTRPWRLLTTCPYEELEKPKRVHLDPFGNAHVCQGLSIGNVWETPLSEIDRDYDHRQHPICGPLVAGGPAKMATDLGVIPQERYVDECHFCYLARQSLLDRFPQLLAPRQVYGLENE